ncbi:hypothetical protein WN55_08009 [Dufourea novaeangliae]|uniref:Uncharacterized protein n=1 Tax=Dufourea novaeangliae TaxID=178035 RepID=A0A154P6Y4_DUFNO|nr:hypothetical protein WN55_08009 [Dufourea novaeangliae]
MQTFIQGIIIIIIVQWRFDSEHDGGLLGRIRCNSTTVSSSSSSFQKRYLDRTESLLSDLYFDECLLHAIKQQIYTSSGRGMDRKNFLNSEER